MKAKSFLIVYNPRLSTATGKMLIKNFGNFFWLKKIIFNIVSGNLFPGTY